MDKTEREETLAADLLKGAEEIADFTGFTPRQVYNQGTKGLPLFYVGKILCGRKSELRAALRSGKVA